MAPISLHKVATVVRWTARVIALLITPFFLFWYTLFGVGSIITDLHGAITANIILPIALGILVLAGCVLSWWWERLGGMLFILASVALAVGPLISGWSTLRILSITNILADLLRGWVIFGLPLLIAGILFLITSWLSRRNAFSLASKAGDTTDSLTITRQ